MWGIRLSGFIVRWKIPTLPPIKHHYIGGVLRGILGHSLFSQACVYKTAQCRDCLLAPQCHYQMVFKPNDDNELAAYVLHDWRIEGDEISVTVLVLNSAANAVESWVQGLHSQLPKLEWFGRRGMQLKSVKDWQTGNYIFQRGRFTQTARLTLVDQLPQLGSCTKLYSVTPLISNINKRIH